MPRASIAWVMGCAWTHACISVACHEPHCMAATVRTMQSAHVKDAGAWPCPERACSVAASMWLTHDTLLATRAPGHSHLQGSHRSLWPADTPTSTCTACTTETLHMWMCVRDAARPMPECRNDCSVYAWLSSLSNQGMESVPLLHPLHPVQTSHHAHTQSSSA